MEAQPHSPGRVEARHHAIAAGKHLALEVRRDSAHLVVHRRHYRDRVLHRVDVRELLRDLADAGKALLDGFVPQVVELEEHVVGVLAHPAPFLDLGRHRARDHVARGQVLHGRRIALHEALAVLVEEISALAAHALGDEDAGARHAGRVELPELHVLERDAGARGHAEAVAGVDERIGGRVEDASRPAGREEHRLGVEDHDLAGLHLERGDTHHLPFGIADEVERHPLHEELRAGVHVALVERVQHRVAGAVGRAAAALHRPLAEILRMPPNGRW
jgi:hypothetical protein